MSENNDIDYFLRRAAEERRIAANLPEGPAALAHRKLAELYDMASGSTGHGRPILLISTSGRS